MSRGNTKDLRSRPCNAADARKRLADAEKYLEVAELSAIRRAGKLVEFASDVLER